MSAPQTLAPGYSIVRWTDHEIDGVDCVDVLIHEDQKGRHHVLIEIHSRHAATWEVETHLNCCSAALTYVKAYIEAVSATLGVLGLGKEETP